ncbi:MAG: HAMP domain-containing sensor histidine kinase [Bryobacteraceae bacterium]
MKPNDPLLMAGLVHDLNNVFQTLVGVAMQLEENPESAKLAATVLRSVERGQRIAAGMQNGHAAWTPFEAVLAQAESFVTDFQSASRGPAVAIIRDVQPGVELDGHWAWERVLINLFLNSIRAMPNGGTIRVTGRIIDSRAEIVVADEGTGIAENVLTRLFEPHVSAHGSSGLGLNIVQNIVKSNGGTIHAANGATGGAEFTILLPQARQSHKAAGAR